MQVLGDKVDHYLPAFKLDFDEKLQKKADFEKVNALVSTKVDKDVVESLIDRVNKMQEQIAEASKQAALRAAEASMDDDDASGSDKES